MWSQSPALPFSAHPCGLLLCLTIPSYHVKFSGGFGTGDRGQVSPWPQIAPRSLSLPMKASLVKTETLPLPQGTLECDCGAGCGPTQVWQVTGSPTQEDAGWGVGRSLSLCVQDGKALFFQPQSCLWGALGLTAELGLPIVDIIMATPVCNISPISHLALFMHQSCRYGAISIFPA